MIETTLKTPPHSAEAEQVVLGTFLRGYIGIEKLEALNEKDFYVPINQELFRVISNLKEGESSFDHSAVFSISSMPSNEIVDYAHEVASGAVTTENVDQYINIIKQRSVLRHLISLAHETAAEKNSMNEKLEDLLDNVQLKVFNILKSDPFMKIETVKDVMGALQSRKMAKIYQLIDQELIKRTH